MWRICSWPLKKEKEKVKKERENRLKILQKIYQALKIPLELKKRT